MKKLIIFQIIVLVWVHNLLAQTKADTIHISHYDINLEIRDFNQKEIKGYTDVSVEAKMAPLQSIYLHLWGLEVDSVKKGDNHLPFLQPQGQQFKIDLPLTTVGQNETIRIFYHGQPIAEQFGGFFFKNDFAYNMGVSMESVPHGFGRVWFPCIDEFTDKSTYTFNITTDADKKAVCGGILVDSADFGNTKRWTWKLTDPIPTYLASVAVGKYLVVKDTVHSISGKILPVEIYADAAKIEKVAGSFVNLKTFFHTFEKRWGACRWQRVGYVLVPFDWGAMEHATNIAYPESYVYGNTNNQGTIAHELAHSWFGNLITCSSSHHMWINEGFATYGEYLCYEMLDPTLQKYKTDIKSLHFSVLNSDGGLYALDNVPTSATYSSTSYRKGGLVAYTLRNYMGDDLFFSSITQLLNENQYGNVTSEQFFQKLSQISGMNELHDFFLGWVHQP
ncbi:MAG: M1 family metallopeptidase, partial [Lentimicrobiaceae bacterium]|nr:M1 family metallopeptidase [Lentimicrobiaceae bacterium]